MATWFTDSWSSLTGWTSRWRGDTWTAATDLTAPSGGAGDWNGLTQDAVDGDANRADADLLAVVNFSSLSARRYFLVVRGSGADESATNYSLAISTATLRIYYCSGSDTPTQVTSASAAITASASTDYWVRIRVNGTALKAKFWSGAAGDEPGGVATDSSWNVSVTDSTVTGAGWVGVSAFASDGVSTWKQLGVGTNGDWAPSSAGGGGYTLTVTQGSYALTGQSVNLAAGRRVAVTQGDYSLAGQSVALRTARNLAATQGAYTLTGQSVTLTKASASALNVTQGAYALTGQNVNLKAARKLGVTQGAYSLTGQSVTLTKSAAGGLNVTQGSYTLNGQAVNLRTARRVSVMQGAYALTGQSVTLTKAAAGRTLNVTQGAYAITGQSVQLRTTRRLAVSFGQYALTGQVVTISYSGLQIFTRPPKRATIAGRPRQVAVLLTKPGRNIGEILKG